MSTITAGSGEGDDEFNQEVSNSNSTIYYELPEGMPIVPLSDARVAPNTVCIDDMCLLLQWKDKEFICAPTPYPTIWPWLGRSPHERYVHMQSRLRDIPLTPSSEVSDHTGDIETHPLFISWRLALLSTMIEEDDLFCSIGHGKSYTLRPSPESEVPLQKVRIGPGAIPDALADKPCGTVQEVLDDLNEVMGTAHSLEATDGLHDFLAAMIGASRDFGELYGRVRPWWYRDAYKDSRAYFEGVVLRVHAREVNDDRDRSALIQDDSYILSGSLPPPRRIWDLYSNRVLPYYVFRKTASLKDDLATIDRKLWMVSHSWVAEEEREGLWTNINGRQWPVPFPRETTLEHLRVELLNHGTEYVWLDVLCLRQVGLVSDEPRRLEEWKIDVPTIGFVYQGEPLSATRYCIVYLNGLGLPCSAADEVLQSDRHWFNRVWTVQEAASLQWLPGGLTAKSATESIWVRLKHTTVTAVDNFLAIPKDLPYRFCTNEVDRAVVVGYCTHKFCKSLPVYRPEVTPEQAWTELLKHFLPDALTSIFLRDATDRPFDPFMSIDAFVRRHTRKHIFTHDYEMLTFLADQLIDCHDPGQMPKNNNLGGYGHIVTTVGPLCVTLESANRPGGEERPIIVRFSNPSASIVLEVAWVHGVLLPDVPYTLANVSFVEKSRKYSTWIAFEAFETGATLCGLPVVRAIKWGVIEFCLDYHDPAPLLDHDGGRVCCVTYMSGEEAVQRSAHTEMYMYAFEEMHAGGQDYTFGTSQVPEDLVSENDPDVEYFEDEGESSGLQRAYEEGEDGAEQFCDTCGSLDLETIGGHTPSLCERKHDPDVGEAQEELASVPVIASMVQSARVFDDDGSPGRAEDEDGNADETDLHVSGIPDDDARSPEPRLHSSSKDDSEWPEEPTSMR